MDPLIDERTDAAREKSLVMLAQRGDGKALEALIKLHQGWVFNIVLRMVPDFHEAEDLSQDILLKTFSRLSSFRGDSRFRTWLYRIAVNHVLNMRETGRERMHRQCKADWADDETMNGYLDREISDPRAIPGDHSLLVKEVMIKCMMAMLLCLNRTQRMVFILGGVLCVGGRLGSELLGISEANFRKILSRSRRRLFNYLNDRCGLVNPDKPCTCERSVPANIRCGFVDPLNILFNAKDAPAIREIVSRARKRLDNIESMRFQDLYRGHPYHEPPDFSKRILEIVDSDDFKELLDTVPSSG